MGSNVSAGIWVKVEAYSAAGKTHLYQWVKNQKGYGI